MNILLIHRDAQLVEEIRYSFQDECKKMVVCQSVAKAKKYLETEDFDFCLTGFQLMDGTAVDFKRMSAEYPIPTIVVAKEDEMKNIVLCLEYGCDDYVHYPIHMMELKARIRAVRRRLGTSGEPMPSDIFDLKIGDLSFAIVTHSVSRGKKSVELAAKEFYILLFLATYEGQVYSREALSATIWPNDPPKSLRTIDVYIRRLRDRLKEIELEDAIVTRWNEGYAFYRYAAAYEGEDRL